MKTDLALPFAAMVSMLLGAAAPAFADGSPGEDYLFRLVPARSGVKFVSFGPSDPQDWFWRDEPRTNAWRRRVAGKLGIRDEESIRIQPSDAPVAVHLDEAIASAELFANRVKDKDRAFSVVVGRTDDGKPTIRTNAFEISKSGMDGISNIELTLMPAGAFRLRSDQGAGEEIWAVTWDELRRQWDSETPERPKTVRKELLDLTRLCENTGSPRPGAARWHERFQNYWTNHPALWPGFIIRNEQPKAVRVSYRLKTPGDTANWSQELVIPANDARPVRALADPKAPNPLDPHGGPGYYVEWRFRPEGGHCLQCCKVQDLFWNVAGGFSESLETVREDDNPFMPPPVLEFGKSFIVHADLWERFDAIAETVEIVYEDGTAIPESVLPGRPPFVRIEPDRVIREVVFHGNDWFDTQTNQVGKKYHCGERATLDGTLKRPAWPSLKLRPSLSPDAINHDATAQSVSVLARVSDERQPKTFEPLEKTWDVPVNMERTLSLETDLDGLAALPRKDGVRLTVSVSASRFETWETNVAGVARGGEALSFEPVLDPETKTWPWKEVEKAIRSTPQFNAALTPPNRRTQHRNDGDGELAKQIWNAFLYDSVNTKIPKAVPLDGLKDHLDECPGCKACRSFVEKHSARLGKSERGKTDRLSVLLAAWEEKESAKAKAACERQDVEQAVKDTTRKTIDAKTKKEVIVPASSNVAVLEAVMRNYLGNGATKP